MTMPVTLRTQTSPHPQFPPGSGVLMRPVGLSSSGFARSMAALALPMRALEEREGPLALLMRAFALSIGTFALFIGTFALSIGAFALFIGTFALFIGAFALFIGAFALFIGAFALFMSAHEERERSTNRPVRGGEKRMKPPAGPVRAHRGPRIREHHLASTGRRCSYGRATAAQPVFCSGINQDSWPKRPGAYKCSWTGSN
jgi:hypothetical protein